MSTTPLPPNKEGATQCIVRWQVETSAGWLGAYNKEAFEAYAQQARADLEAENARLRGALHRIDSIAVFLPAFDVLHEGGIEAVTQNIVEAISKAVAALENTK